MTPAEVREIIRRLWANNEEVMGCLYAVNQRTQHQGGGRKPGKKQGLRLPRSSGGDFETAFRMFFLQTIAVPPNNVRPMAKTGDMVVDHPQNQALTQVRSSSLSASEGFAVSMNSLCSSHQKQRMSFVIIIRPA